MAARRSFAPTPVFRTALAVLTPFMLCRTIILCLSEGRHVGTYLNGTVPAAWAGIRYMWRHGIQR